MSNRLQLSPLPKSVEKALRAYAKDINLPLANAMTSLLVESLQSMGYLEKVETKEMPNQHPNRALWKRTFQP